MNQLFPVQKFQATDSFFGVALALFLATSLTQLSCREQPNRSDSEVERQSRLATVEAKLDEVTERLSALEGQGASEAFEKILAGKRERIAQLEKEEENRRLAFEKLIQSQAGSRPSPGMSGADMRRIEQARKERRDRHESDLNFVRHELERERKALLSMEEELVKKLSTRFSQPHLDAEPKAQAAG